MITLCDMHCFLSFYLLFLRQKRKAIQWPYSRIIHHVLKCLCLGNYCTVKVFDTSLKLFDCRKNRALSNNVTQEVGDKSYCLN